MDSFDVLQGGTGNYMLNKADSNKPIVHLGSSISELNSIKDTESSLEFGSCVKLVRMEEFFRTYTSSLSTKSSSYRLGKVFSKALSTLASVQIRNTASVGGSIMWQHPSSDLMTLYILLGCQIRVQQPNGRNIDILINDSFISHQSDEIRKSNSVITSLIVPKLSDTQYIGFYKKSKRKEFALSVVNMGILLNYERIQNKEEPRYGNVRIVIGGTDNPGHLWNSGHHTFAKLTMEAIEGKKEVSRSALVDAMHKDLPTNADYKQLGTYRQGLAISFIEQFLANIHHSVGMAEMIEIQLKRESTQSYQKVNKSQPDYDEVERPIAHICSAEQG